MRQAASAAGSGKPGRLHGRRLDGGLGAQCTRHCCVHGAPRVGDVMMMQQAGHPHTQAKAPGRMRPPNDAVALVALGSRASEPLPPPRRSPRPPPTSSSCRPASARGPARLGRSCRTPATPLAAGRLHLTRCCRGRTCWLGAWGGGGTMVGGHAGAGSGSSRCERSGHMLASVQDLEDTCHPACFSPGMRMAPCCMHPLLQQLLLHVLCCTHPCMELHTLTASSAPA